MPKIDKPLAQKVDERVFEQLLKYNPQTQNLWDIVGIFENERQKLRIEIAQYHEDIKNSQAKLKELREGITKAQNILRAIEQKISESPVPPEKEESQKEALMLKISELELENSMLLVELRDLKSEYQLEENLHQMQNMRETLQESLEDPSKP